MPPAIKEIDAHTHNHLVGSQIGGELRRDWERLHLGLEGKAGLFANIFEQRRSNLNSTGVQPGGFPEIVPVDDSEHDAGVAGVLDFSATLSYQLTRHLSARGGYQLLYVAGLALCPTNSVDSRTVETYSCTGPRRGWKWHGDATRGTGGIFAGASWKCEAG